MDDKDRQQVEHTRLVYEQMRWAFDVKAMKQRSDQQAIATLAAAGGVILGLLFTVGRSGSTLLFFFGLIFSIASLVCALFGYRTSTINLAIPLHPMSGRPATTIAEYLTVSSDSTVAMLETWSAELGDVLLAREFEQLEQRRSRLRFAQTVLATLALCCVLGLAVISGSSSSSSPSRGQPSPSPTGFVTTGGTAAQID